MLTLGMPLGYVLAALLYTSPPPPTSCVFFDSPPTPTCGGVLNVQVGQLLTFTVQASDQTCTLPIFLEAGLLELPGATTNPPLPTSASSVVSCVVSWTPTIDNVGTHNIVFHAVSGCCPGDAFCNMVVNVIPAPTGCALTLGFWKTHACSWPAPFDPGTPNATDANHNGTPDNLEGQCSADRRNPYSQCPCDGTHTILIGANSYTQCQLLCALVQSGTGNAVRILSVQLIAAKLNALEGTSVLGIVIDPLDPTNPYNGLTVAQLIAQGDSLIGGSNILTAVRSTKCTGSHADPVGCNMVKVGKLLDLFNNGLGGGVPHCQ